MFDVGWSELLVIGVVALIAIGPKELPSVLRTVGQWMGKVRRMAAEFQGQFQEAMREAEMADIKKSVDEMTSAATNITNFDPMETMRKEVESLSDFNAQTSSSAASTPEATAASASPEAAAPSTPAPVSSDFAIPQPEPDLTVAAEAPQPKPASGGGG